jgi:FG-GAP repeat
MVKTAAKTMVKMATAVVVIAVCCCLAREATASLAVHEEQKISDTEGNFQGVLANGTRFGIAVAALGDVDGDTTQDLAVGADGENGGGLERGAVYVLFLHPNGTVKASQKISDTEGNFQGVLKDLDHFGCSVSGMGDFDGDATPDLTVGAYGDDDGSFPGSQRGVRAVAPPERNSQSRAEDLRHAGQLPGRTRQQ